MSAKSIIFHKFLICASHVCQIHCQLRVSYFINFSHVHLIIVDTGPKPSHVKSGSVLTFPEYIVCVCVCVISDMITSNPFVNLFEIHSYEGYCVYMENMLIWT